MNLDKYIDRKFEEWKKKVSKRLPNLVIKFYQYKKDGNYIPYEKEVLLGSVIKDIHDIWYLYNKTGFPIKRLDGLEKITAQVVLETHTQLLFKYIKELA